MRKNTLYIILSISTFLAIFTTAATCNMCGFSMSPTAETEQAQGEDVTPAGENRETEVETVLETNDEDETSYPPEITTIIFNGDDITQRLESEELRIHFGETEMDRIFTIIAEDTDSDELNFSVEVSEGEIQDLHNTDSKTAEFSYIAPVRVPAEGDIPYPGSITVSASDADGNTDVFLIDIGFVPQITAFQLPEVSTVSLNAVVRETGSINIGGSEGDDTYTGEMYIGDSGDNGMSTAHLSFNITDLAGVEVESATLTMEIFEVVGDNISFLDYLRIATTNYGARPLRVSDASITGNRIAQLPNSTTNISCSSSELINELQRKIDASTDRFQLKIYWSNPNSNDDGGPDGLKYQVEDVSLTIQYRE